ncbi:hypothetical protein NEIELOOT_01593 [Neisseria elongata subsp. glycolytica ATCC 29315]|uniref:Uncharacterized protein n=1 Tax=Neisseria elongata subsp. glycolytica ATCC 29315 TaxID=546263 RepID=D4DRA0_NEIEG|nr:hypothetical protein NEIELOOT_01593 [Neisseria elongata subsp. glycolytica ATCC 29315]
MPRLAVLSVLSAASSPCPDLNLIHYIGKFKLFEILICINLFYANGYMLLMRCRNDAVYCFEKAAI